MNHSDVSLGLIPMFHGYGMLVNCSCMTVGGKLIVLKYFDRELFLKSIHVQKVCAHTFVSWHVELTLTKRLLDFSSIKVTILFAVTPLMVFLAKDPAVDDYDLSSLKIIYSGAAPLPKEILLDVIQRLRKDGSLKILQGYGMTESCVVSTLYDANITKCVHGSVGKVICGMAAKVSRV